ncbi:hypothetical protein ISS86_03055 [Candidatus Microgenomates bacterium]|nr:hypothetical protein [Candidatus Microgenomates bacterium]
MKRKITKPAILIGIILVFFLSLLRMVLVQQERVEEISTSRSSPIIIEKESKVKVWLEEKTPDCFLLIGDSGETKYDTFQLVFKAETKILKDFIPSDFSDFTLRVKSFKEKEVILLFSTEGELRALKSNQSLGEFLLFPRADISGLIINQDRTKIIKRGEGFSVGFEGVKK